MLKLYWLLLPEVMRKEILPSEPFVVELEMATLKRMPSVVSAPALRTLALVLGRKASK